MSKKVESKEVESKKVDRNKIAKFCSETLQNYCFSNTVDIIQDNSEQNRYYLTDPKSVIASAINDTGTRLVVVKFTKEEESYFWIHFSIVFKTMPTSAKQNDYFLNGISLQIYKGLATNNNKDLLFRAEWDNKDEINEHKHPQPHWHIHQQKEEIRFSEFLGEFEIEPDFEDYINNKNREDKNKSIIPPFNTPKFHFAMSVIPEKDWFSNKKHIIPLNEKKLNYWLEGILAHIDTQLKYCVR